MSLSWNQKKVCCSGSTQQATWKGGYETYDWSDHVPILSLGGGGGGGGGEGEIKRERIQLELDHSQ